MCVGVSGFQHDSQSVGTGVQSIALFAFPYNVLKIIGLFPHQNSHKAHITLYLTDRWVHPSFFLLVYQNVRSSFGTKLIANPIFVEETAACPVQFSCSEHG